MKCKIQNPKFKIEGNRSSRHKKSVLPTDKTDKPPPKRAKTKIALRHGLYIYDISHNFEDHPHSNQLRMHTIYHIDIRMKTNTRQCHRGQPYTYYNLATSRYNLPPLRLLHPTTIAATPLMPANTNPHPSQHTTQMLDICCAIHKFVLLCVGLILRFLCMYSCAFPEISCTHY